MSIFRSIFRHDPRPVYAAALLKYRSGAVNPHACFSKVNTKRQ